MKWFGLEGTNVVEKSLNIKQGFSLHLDQFLQHKNVLMGLIRSAAYAVKVQVTLAVFN